MRKTRNSEFRRAFIEARGMAINRDKEKEESRVARLMADYDSVRLAEGFKGTHKEKAKLINVGITKYGFMRRVIRDFPIREDFENAVRLDKKLNVRNYCPVERDKTRVVKLYDRFMALIKRHGVDTDGEEFKEVVTRLTLNVDHVPIHDDAERLRHTNCMTCGKTIPAGQMVVKQHKTGIKYPICQDCDEYDMVPSETQLLVMMKLHNDSMVQYIKKFDAETKVPLSLLVDARVRRGNKK